MTLHRDFNVIMHINILASCRSRKRLSLLSLFKGFFFCHTFPTTKSARCSTPSPGPHRRRRQQSHRISSDRAFGRSSVFMAAQGGGEGGQVRVFVLRSLCAMVPNTPRYYGTNITSPFSRIERKIHKFEDQTTGTGDGALSLQLNHFNILLDRRSKKNKILS